MESARRAGAAPGSPLHLLAVIATTLRFTLHVSPSAVLGNFAPSVGCIRPYTVQPHLPPVLLSRGIPLAGCRPYPVSILSSWSSLVPPRQLLLMLPGGLLLCAPPTNFPITLRRTLDTLLPPATPYLDASLWAVETDMETDDDQPPSCSSVSSESVISDPSSDAESVIEHHE